MILSWGPMSLGDAAVLGIGTAYPHCPEVATLPAAAMACGNLCRTSAAHLRLVVRTANDQRDIRKGAEGQGSLRHLNISLHSLTYLLYSHFSV